MYDWRQMTPHERDAVLAERRLRSFPWHSPPHQVTGGGRYHVTAASCEHAPIIGKSVPRMEEWSAALLEAVRADRSDVLAWCVLPNHCHLLVETKNLRRLLRGIGTLHGRTAHRWNGEEDARGRTVWRGCADRFVRSERHLWVTVNHIHQNPVYHGYVARWRDWPFGSARAHLEHQGVEESARIWREFPVRGAGAGWDDPAQ